MGSQDTFKKFCKDNTTVDFDKIHYGQIPQN